MGFDFRVGSAISTLSHLVHTHSGVILAKHGGLAAQLLSKPSPLILEFFQEMRTVEDGRPMCLTFLSNSY